jgi:molybdenum cofactor cytidylyltransferase
MLLADAPIVGGVLLAAGLSSRMGHNKLLLEVGGQSLVKRAARAAIDAGLAPVLVVVGHEAERVRDALSGLSCTFVHNANYAEGVGTSLKAGVSAAGSLPRAESDRPHGVDAIVVMLADMPFVTAEMIRAVADRYRATRAKLVVSRYGSVEAPPNCYDRALFGELLSEPGERCAKRVVRRHLDEASIVPWPEPRLRDLDVIEDYERIRAEVEARA